MTASASTSSTIPTFAQITASITDRLSASGINEPELLAQAFVENTLSLAPGRALKKVKASEAELQSLRSAYAAWALSMGIGASTAAATSAAPVAGTVTVMGPYGRFQPAVILKAIRDAIGDLDVNRILVPSRPQFATMLGALMPSVEPRNPVYDGRGDDGFRKNEASALESELVIILDDNHPQDGYCSKLRTFCENRGINHTVVSLAATTPADSPTSTDSPF